MATALLTDRLRLFVLLTGLPAPVLQMAAQLATVAEPKNPPTATELADATKVVDLLLAGTVTDRPMLSDPAAVPLAAASDAAAAPAPSPTGAAAATTWPTHPAEWDRATWVGYFADHGVSIAAGLTALQQHIERHPGMRLPRPFGLESLHGDEVLADAMVQHVRALAS